MKQLGDEGTIGGQKLPDMGMNTKMRRREKTAIYIRYAYSYCLLLL